MLLNIFSSRSCWTTAATSLSLAVGQISPKPLLLVTIYEDDIIFYSLNTSYSLDYGNRIRYLSQKSF